MSVSLSLLVAVGFAEVLPAAAFLYAGYWAFAMRRALTSRIYKRVALLVGVVAVYSSFSVFITYSSSTIVNDLIGVYFAILFFIIFAFVDSFIPVARRSDPLLRSVLGWERFRKFLWVDAIAFSTLAFVTSAPQFNFSNPWFGQANLVATAVFLVAAVSVFGVSAAALITAARRSVDPLFRGTLIWMGRVLALGVTVFVVAFAVAALPGVTLYDTYYSYAALPSGAIFVGMGYCLYRSARSLAPMNRIQIADPVV